MAFCATPLLSVWLELEESWPEKPSFLIFCLVFSSFFLEGQEDYDRLRPLSYPQTDLFIIAFSTVSKSGLKDVTNRWYPEVSHHCPGVPILLVGTKIDLRDGGVPLPASVVPVSQDEALKVVTEIGAIGYEECSALDQTNLVGVFSAAVRAAVMKDVKSGSSSSSGGGAENPLREVSSTPINAKVVLVGDGAVG